MHLNPEEAMLTETTHSPFPPKPLSDGLIRSRARKHLPAAVTVLVILALAAWFTNAVLVDVLASMPGEIRIAVIIAAFLAIVVGGGLSALLFYSSRAGFDDKAQLRFDEPADTDER
jgi:hypothetical protein